MDRADGVMDRADGVMDHVGVTVKEAWVKAKVVSRKKGAQMVLSPLLPPPPPPPPIFPHDRSLHYADSLKLRRLNTGNRNQQRCCQLRSGQFWLTRSACFLLIRLMEQYK